MSKQGPGEMEDEEQSQDWLFGGEIQDDGGFNYMEPWNYGNSHEEYERGDQGHLLVSMQHKPRAAFGPRA